MHCSDNDLLQLNLRNNNNNLIEKIYCENNVALTCIDVDDESFNSFTWWQQTGNRILYRDPWALLSVDCNVK